MDIEARHHAILNLLGVGWYSYLKDEFDKPYFRQLGSYIQQLRGAITVYPEREDIFRAFKLTPLREVKVVVLGNDPYNDGSADGLAFSSKKSSNAVITNILFATQITENFHINSIEIGTGDLSHWAKQGVLLLNTTLTSEKGTKDAHVGKWNAFSNYVLKQLNTHTDKTVFIFIGKVSQQFKGLIDQSKHRVIEVEHPGVAIAEQRAWNFQDCFQATNLFLINKGTNKILW